MKRELREQLKKELFLGDIAQWMFSEVYNHEIVAWNENETRLWRKLKKELFLEDIAHWMFLVVY